MQLTRPAPLAEQAHPPFLTPVLDEDDPLARPRPLQRLLDVLFAGLGLLFLWPLFLLIAFADWSQDGGPIFYRARRVGRRGHHFDLYKFRTMITGADKLGPAITTAGDARVTSIGRFLRRTKLDELPQLFNVLRGEMSLVGPRPEDQRYVALYNDEQRRVLLVRPGITSAASLAYSHEEDLLSGPDWETVYRSEIMPAKIDLDLDYLAHHSLWSDLQLVLRTLGRVFSHGYLVALGGLLALIFRSAVEWCLSLPLRLRNRHILVLDLLVFLLAPILALQLRLDEDAGTHFYTGSLVVIVAAFMLVKLLVLFPGGLYSRYWRYAAIPELAQIAMLSAVVLVAQTLVLVLLLRPLGLVAHDFPRSVPVIEALLAMPTVLALRFSVPVAARLQRRMANDGSATPTIVAGAGDAGIMIVEEMKRNRALGLRPIAFVDDDPDKQGLRVRGVPVLGGCADIPRIARYTRARQVVIAMPTAPARTRREIAELCEQGGVKVKTIPDVYEVLSGRVAGRRPREIRVEQLLKREPIVADVAAVRALVSGRRVLVAGGGGTIGGELCRQLLACDPGRLVVLGHGENSIFAIRNELEEILARRNALGSGAEAHPAVEIIPLIADIRLRSRIAAIFAEYRPDIVFHAAAHKRVELLEANPLEAVTNNILGTRNLLEAARAVGVGHFMMISTDRAANPATVMGASKRAAELLVQEMARASGQSYSSVRFGSVLDSRDGVVSAFRRQIEAGSPLTVPHPALTRYLMTAREAVALVLQTATFSRGGEVFVLDMGKPIGIVDLAHEVIRLAGLEPDDDITVTCGDAAPGDNPEQDLIVDVEDYRPTGHERIFIAGTASGVATPDLRETMRSLEAEVERDDRTTIISLLQQVVPEYRPPQRVSRIDATRQGTPSGGDTSHEIELEELTRDNPDPAWVRTNSQLGPQMRRHD